MKSYPVYKYACRNRETGAIFYHRRGFRSYLEFRGQLVVWSEQQPLLWEYYPVLPVDPIGYAADLTTIHSKPVQEA